MAPAKTDDQPLETASRLGKAIEEIIDFLKPQVHEIEARLLRTRMH